MGDRPTDGESYRRDERVLVASYTGLEPGPEHDSYHRYPVWLQVGVRITPLLLSIFAALFTMLISTGTDLPLGHGQCNQS